MKSTKYVSPEDEAYRKNLERQRHSQERLREYNWGREDFVFDSNFYDKFFTKPNHTKNPQS